MDFLEKYNLSAWFDATFDNSEKKILLSCPIFQPGAFLHDCAAYDLADSLQWYNKKENTALCLKVCTEILELLRVTPSIDVLNLHFIYLNLINTLYKQREIETALKMCVVICNDSIAIAPQAAEAFRSQAPYLPTHVGFTQLAIIEKKNKNYARVVELCEIAKAQGWAGDWDKRINEARAKLSG